MTDLDPFHRDLDELGRQYTLLAAKVPPGQGEGGRRPPPASRPPLQIDPVSLMAEVEQAVSYYLNQIRWLLQPIRRIDITKRTGAICPWCQGGLVAWLHEERAEPGEVVCLTPIRHQPTEPYRWTGEAEWRRLGVVAGVYVDARYGARPPSLHAVEQAE